MNLSGKTVLVTGASRGIGKEIAGKLLESGAAVVGTTSRSEFPASLRNNRNFEGISVDFSEKKNLKRFIKPLFEREQAPGVLVNNAGIFEEAGFESSDLKWLENWDTTMQVNLRTPALLSKWALNRWTSDGEGLLVNITSRAAHRGDTGGYASYAASKGALTAFTKTVARAFGRHGITAYSIAPGYTKTDMAKKAAGQYGEDYLAEDMVFDEITSPVEIAELVTFLSTGKVSHMTGSTFHINGGSFMI